MQIEKLKLKVQQIEQMDESYLIDREKLYTLYDKGIIDKSRMLIQMKEETDVY